VPWRLGAKPVSIYASPPGLTFGAKAPTGSFQELARNGVKGGFVEGMSGVREKSRYKYRLSSPSYGQFFIFLSFPSLFNAHFPTFVPVELIFLQKFGGWEKWWLDDQG